jgi:hypothetical protein
VKNIFILNSDRIRSGVRVVYGSELVRELGTTATRRSHIYNFRTQHRRFFFLDSSAVHAPIIVVATVAARRHQFTLSRRPMHVRPDMRAPGRCVSAGARVHKTFLGNSAHASVSVHCTVTWLDLLALIAGRWGGIPFVATGERQG